MNKAVAICAFKKFDLTSRESDVLLCITRGSSNAEIGINLGISPRTVKKHLEHIYGKLGVKSRLGAAAKASAASLGFARANAKRTESGADALYEI